MFVITESKFFDIDGRVIKTIGRVTERGAIRDKCDACHVDCISRVRHLVGCLAITDEYIQHHLDYIFDRAVALLFATLDTVEWRGEMRETGQAELNRRREQEPSRQCALMF